jgi:hypothetical protein
MILKQVITFVAASFTFIYAEAHDFLFKGKYRLSQKIIKINEHKKENYLPNPVFFAVCF